MFRCDVPPDALARARVRERRMRLHAHLLQHRHGDAARGSRARRALAGEHGHRDPSECVDDRRSRGSRRVRASLSRVRSARCVDERVEGRERHPPPQRRSRKVRRRRQSGSARGAPRVARGQRMDCGQVRRHVRGAVGPLEVRSGHRRSRAGSRPDRSATSAHRLSRAPDRRSCWHCITLASRACR